MVIPSSWTISTIAFQLHHGKAASGTVCIDRKHNHTEVTSATLRKGQTIARYAEGIMVVKWKDKRVMLHCSNKLENEMCTVLNKRKQEHDKPLPTVQYNTRKGMVDRSDQMLPYHSCGHKTLKRYKKISVHALQLMLINYWSLYSMFNINKLNLFDYRITVIQYSKSTAHKTVRTTTGTSTQQCTNSCKKIRA